MKSGNICINSDSLVVLAPRPDRYRLKVNSTSRALAAQTLKQLLKQLRDEAHSSSAVAMTTALTTHTCARHRINTLVQITFFFCSTAQVFI